MWHQAQHPHASAQGQGSPRRASTTSALELKQVAGQRKTLTFQLEGGVEPSFCWPPPLGFRRRQPLTRSQSQWTECSPRFPMKIFTEHTSDKGLRSRIYKEH